MSDTFDSMLTPEQARMMYAAFLERLPESSVAAQSIARNVENPLDFVSVANRQPSQVAPVTQGVAAMPPPAEADLPPPRTTPVEQAAGADVSPTTPQSQADALTRLRELIGGGDRPSQADISRDALTNFFFSMAASRNPSFFGQLGEAGQALTRTQAEARASARQERQVDVEAAYRAASEARQLREDLANEDPNSLRGRYIRAQIANLEAQAVRSLRGPAEQRRRVVDRQRDAEGNLYLVYDDGTVSRAGGAEGPAFIDRTNTPQGRIYQDWLNRRAAASERIRTSSALMSDDQRNAAMRGWLRDNPEPANPFAPRSGTTAATGGAAPTVDNLRRYDAYGQPIDQ